MTFKYKKLLGKIKEKYGTQYNFSIAMGLSERTISMKLNSQRPWTDKEMEKAIDILEIPVNQIHLYFFQ